MIENPVAVVGVTGNDRISIMPISPKLMNMTKEQAIDLAVRIVAVADDGETPTFGKLLREFMNT